MLLFVIETKLNKTNYDGKDLSLYRHLIDFGGPLVFHNNRRSVSLFINIG